MICTRTIVFSIVVCVLLSVLPPRPLWAEKEPHTRETLKSLDSLLEGDPNNNINPLTPGQMRAFQKLLARIEQEETAPKDSKTSYDPSVKKAMQVMFGNLTPDQIRTIRKALDEIEKAKSEPVTIPNLVQRTIPVDLEPGAKITRIMLGQNHITTLAFFDNTGEPFPVERYSPSIEKIFEVTHPKNPEKRHILEVSPKKHYKYGNASVTFEGLNVPVTLQLVVGFDTRIDATLSIIIPRPGPNAKIENFKPVFSGLLSPFLDGTPPSGAKLMKNNGWVKVWEYDGLLYIRTKADLVLPPPLDQGSSGEGTSIYQTNKTSSLRLAIDGQYKVVKINE